MIQFLNLALAGGLAALAAPIIVHLLHRRRIRPVPWGAMRFLQEALAKHRRRLQLEELLLLLLRVLIVALVATALLRPALRLHRQAAGRAGRVAAVLLLDDSLSSVAGRSRSAFADVQQLALAYLDTLQPGDEVSVIPVSRLSRVRDDPMFDLAGARALVLSLHSTPAASDVPALLEAGLDQLKRHVNPAAELVLAFDGRADGWNIGPAPRWEELRARLRGPPAAVPGTRQRPHLFVLTPSTAPPEGNLAVTSLRLDRTLVTTNLPVAVRVELSHFGTAAPSNATVRVLVDGRAIGQQAAPVRPQGRETLVFPLTFAHLGSHLIEACLESEADCLSLDNQRAVSVVVENAVPVLLVEGALGEGLQGELGFVAAALDPSGTGASAFRCRRIPVAQLSEDLLRQHRVVVLGDVPALTGENLEALERHVISGGGLLMALAERTAPDLLNRFWYRNGTGLLPAALAARSELSPRGIPAGLDRSHPVFNAFATAGAEVWAEAGVRWFYRLEPASWKVSETRSLLWLDHDEPLLVERRRGTGLVILCTTSLSRRWNDLPLLAAYVPLVRGMVGHLGNYVYPPRDLVPGDRLVFVSSESGTPAANNPAGEPLALRASVWEGRPAWVSEPLLEVGGYCVRQDGQNHHFAVAASPNESALKPLAPADLKRALGEAECPLLTSAEAVGRALNAGARGETEIWRWLVLAGVILMFVETGLTRREGGLSGGPLPEERRRTPPAGHTAYP